MSAMASRVALLPDMSQVLVLRPEETGAEERDGLDPVNIDGELPPWLRADGISNPAVLLWINVTTLVGTAQIGLHLWSAVNGSDAVEVWTSPQLVLGHQNYVLDPHALMQAGPEGAAFLGVAYRLSGVDPRLDFSARLVKAVRPY